MKKAPLCSVLLLLLLGALTGCSRYYWSKPGASAEQFTQDNQACLRQAAGALPSGASLEAVEQYYRACLGSLGYARDKQVDPPPPGSHRGIESGEEFNAAVQAAMAQAPRSGFEQQLAQLDDLKARGRITEDEYATMRKRLVESVTVGALTPVPAVSGPAAGSAAPPPTLTGRWYGRDRSVLDIRGEGRQLAWEWEIVTDRVTMRASGAGSAAEKPVSLVGRVTGFGFGSLRPYSFSLTWDGPVLRGSATGPNNLPRDVEFRRDRP